MFISLNSDKYLRSFKIIKFFHHFDWTLTNFYFCVVASTLIRLIWNAWVILEQQVDHRSVTLPCHGRDDDDGDELFLRDGWSTKDVKSYIQSKPLSGILIVGNLRHARSRIWTCAEPSLGFVKWSSAAVITTASRQGRLLKWKGLLKQFQKIKIYLRNCLFSGGESSLANLKAGVLFV